MIGALIAKSKVTSSYDLLNAKNIEKFLANWHKESVWRFPGNLSVSGEFKGKDAVAKWFEKLVNQFPRFVLTPKNVCVKKLV